MQKESMLKLAGLGDARLDDTAADARADSLSKGREA